LPEQGHGSRQPARIRAPQRSRSGVRMALGLAITTLFLTSCWWSGGPPLPDRVVRPTVVGVVDSVDRSDPRQLAVSLRGGKTVNIDRERAVDLGGPGVAAGRLLLFGEGKGREWYVSSSIAETSPVPNCYFARAAAAFDEPDAVVFVFIDLRDVGIRLRKAEGFITPTDELTSSGQYPQGEVAHDLGSFCLNSEGLVFGFP